MHHQYMNVSGSLSTSSSVLKNCRWHKFQGLFGNHLWVDNHIWCFFRLQNKKTFVCLTVKFFYLFDKPLLTWFQGFRRTNHLWAINHVDVWWRHQNKEIFVYLNGDCLCLSDKRCCHELLGFCGANQVIYEPKITLIRRDLLRCLKIYYFYCKNVDGRHKKSSFSVIYFF